MIGPRYARGVGIAAVMLAVVLPGTAHAAEPSFTLYTGAGAPQPASAPDAAAHFETDTVRASVSDDRLTINAGPPESPRTVTIRPPWGSTLAPSTFRTRDNPHPPEGTGGLGVSGPSGCWPGGPGWVDIEELEVEPDKTVSKLRVLFICGESFGEVRIGVDSQTAATRLQPQRIRWPIVERERRGLTVPVLVSQDTGSATVGAATVIGPQAAAFPTVENECTGKTLTAGQDCAIWIEPDPSAVGTHTAELRVPVGATTLTTRLEIEEAGRTRLLVRSRDEHTVTGGGDWWLDPSDSVFDVATWWNGHMRYRATPLDGGEAEDDWHFDLRTPDRRPLVEGGTYPLSQATRDIRVTSYGAECWADGTLTIHELRPGIWSRFDGLSAGLSLSCRGVPAMDVLLEYRATGPEPAFAATFPFGTAWTWGPLEFPPDDEELEPPPDDDELALPPATPVITRPPTAPPTRRPLASRPVRPPAAASAPVAARPATAVRSCQRDAGRALRLQMGTSRNDRLTGTTPGDRLLGRAGNDRLLGRGGGDCLDGGPGNDRISGESGDDMLIGGAGADTLDGGRGNDVIVAGPGRDIVRCGSGRDVAIVGREDRVLGCERVTRR